MPETERKRNALMGDVLTLSQRLESVLAGCEDHRVRTDCLAELSDLGHLSALLKQVQAAGSIRAIAAMLETRRQRVDQLERVGGAGLSGSTPTSR